MRFIILFLFVINIFANDEVYYLNLPQEVSEENILSDNIATSTNINTMKIAVVLDKKRFFQFIPSILNSMNAYMIKKDINYDIKLFDKEDNLTQEFNQITQNYKYIFTYFTNPSELNLTSKYPQNYFFVPTLNKKQVDNNISENIFFGGIDYANQVSKLNQFISGKTFIIYEDRELSKYITSIIDNQLLQPHIIRKYPIQYDKSYDNNFVYLNTNVVNTAQILANFTYHKIDTNAILSTQLNYTPLLFSLTSSADVSNLILANSIFNINPIIEDNNKNIGSDIDFNWLNYTTSTLLNLAYNLEINEDKHFLNDFNLYMFFNQIEYKTNLYKIFQHGFIQIEN